MIPHPPCEEQERHREHCPVCLPRKRDETGIEGEEEGEDQRRARMNLLTEKVGSKDQGAPCQRREETREEVRAFHDGEQNSGEKNVCGLRRKQGRFAAREGEGLQGECRFRVGERRRAQRDESQGEGDEKSQPVQPAFVFDGGGIHGRNFTLYGLSLRGGAQKTQIFLPYQRESAFFCVPIAKPNSR